MNKNRIIGLLHQARISLIFILILSYTQSCRSADEVISCFPQSSISVQINVNQPLYIQLQNIGGWANLAMPGTGSAGLILVRTGAQSFKAYDKNAPHLCPGNATVLYVKNDNKLICDADASEWILLTGEPIKIANVPPKMYPVQYNPQTGDISIYY